MDVFWLIPIGIVAIVFMITFYAYIRTQPSSPSTPNVLLDKPSDESPMDQADKDRDWSGRPCGSYLDWLFGRSK
jgi:hypothetical protein